MFMVIYLSPTDINIFQYAFFNPQDNPGIDYKYYVGAINALYTPKYTWDFVEWSECSAKCDGGTMVINETY